MSRAFLIGAGATRSQYIYAPLSGDFFEMLHQFNGTLFDKISNEIKPYFGDRDLRRMNVEDVMIASNEFSLSNRMSFLEVIYIAIYELLAERTESTIDKMSNAMILTRSRGPSIFKTMIGDSRLSNDDFFITLNYDLYLDREILLNCGGVDYGFEKPHKNLNFPDLPIDMPRLKQPILSVYHLHGSLNWMMIDDQLHISLGAIYPTLLRSGSNICLVPPGDKKLHSFLLPIWKKAEDRLIKADELVIIGCSLNIFDHELIQLVKKFIDNKGVANVKVIFRSNMEFPKGYPLGAQMEKIGWADPEIQNYQKTLGKNFKFYPWGFSISGPPGQVKSGALEFILQK
jgi:hypothetical protein